MEEIIKHIMIVCPLVFIAGFVDAVAGGGGLISLPAYMMTGMPIHMAAGSNKFSASCGTIIAAGKYIKSGKIKWQVAIYSALGAVVGSIIGTNLALYISDKHLKLLMLIAIPLVALFIMTQKHLGESLEAKEMSALKLGVLSIGIGLSIGCYDGLIGPGTGTFMILGFSGLLGLDLVTSSGCAKVSNLASNITSVILYFLGGKVLFTLAIPAAFCSTLGGYMGARFAVKGGAKNVRTIIWVVIGLLFIKLAYDLLG